MKARIAVCAICHGPIVAGSEAPTHPNLHQRCLEIDKAAAESMRQKYEPRQAELACHKCGKVRKVGERFCLGKKTRRGRKRVWCWDCFKAYVTAKGGPDGVYPDQ